MQAINSVSTDYSSLFEDIVSKQVNEIKKGVIVEELSSKVAMASAIADDIMMGMTDGSYQMDSVIPEGSTVSYHV